MNTKKNRKKVHFTPQQKKELQNKIYTWIIFACIVFWTISSVLGIVGFARSIRTSYAECSTTSQCDVVAAHSIEDKTSVSKIARDKRAYANSSFPPSTSYDNYLPSFYGFNIRFELSDLIGEFSPYTLSYALPFTYNNGRGTTIYEYNDRFPVYTSINGDSTLYNRFDLRSGEFDYSTTEIYVTASWELGNVYVDELLYEHLFGGFSLSLGGATSYEFPVFDYEVTMYVRDLSNGELNTVHLEYYEETQVGGRFLEFNNSQWEDIYALYGYEGYVSIEDYYVTYRVNIPYFADYISLTLNHISEPILTSYFNEVQDNVSQYYFNYFYNNGQSNGYVQGYEEGKAVGFDEGLNSASDYSFLSLLTSVVDAPFQVFYDMFDFNILGYNMSSFFLALLSACVVLAVLKVILGR